MEQPVTRRALFFIGGYDPKTPEAFFGRMGKEISRFDALWGTQSQIFPHLSDELGEIACASIEARDERASWSTSNDFTFLSLNSIVLADFNRPVLLRLLRYLRCFSGFIICGSAPRFFVKAWRFGLYFLYPFVTLMIFATAGLLVSLLTKQALGVASVALGLLVFYGLVAVFGKRWSLLHLMDLWSFSYQFMHGARPDADALLQRYAEEIAKRVKTDDYDEILLIGHSTGGMLILDVAARTLALDENFAKRARKVSLLTLGSTALKAGLCRSATGFRDSVAKLVATQNLQWVEIQCLTDPINFYRTDVVKEMGLATASRQEFPLIRTVRIKDMLQPDTYRRIKRNFFRVHYQYVFGNTKASWYDFFQICCGPIFLEDRARRHIIGNPSSEEQSCHDA